MLGQQKMDDSETDEDWDEKVGGCHKHGDFVIVLPSLYYNRWRKPGAYLTKMGMERSQNRNSGGTLINLKKMKKNVN